MTILLPTRGGSVLLAATIICTAARPGLAQTETGLPPQPAAAAARPLDSNNLSTLSRAPQPTIWRGLFADTVRDARRLPSTSTLVWLAIGALAAGGTHPADTTIARSLGDVRVLHEPLEPGAVLGSTPLQLGASMAAYALGRMADRPRVTMVAADLVRAQLLGEGLTFGMKQSFRRRRPEGSGFAFPSGHTTVSFASATVLQRHFGWRIGAPAYGVASYVALSRVQMKRHYLSDVAFGAALGVAAGRTVTIGRVHRMELSPMATPGGGGVQVNWLGRGAAERTR
jgi:membrane-associated phospholipid phosphatase